MGGNCSFFPSPSPSLFAPATHTIKLLVVHSFYRFQLCQERAWARINVGLSIGIGVTSPPFLFLLSLRLNSTHAKVFLIPLIAL